MDTTGLQTPTWEFSQAALNITSMFYRLSEPIFSSGVSLHFQKNLWILWTKFCLQICPWVCTLEAVLPRLSFSRVIPNLPSCHSHQWVSRIYSPLPERPALAQHSEFTGETSHLCHHGLTSEIDSVVLCHQEFISKDSRSVGAGDCLQLLVTAGLCCQELVVTVLAVGCWTPSLPWGDLKPNVCSLIGTKMGVGQDWVMHWGFSYVSWEMLRVKPGCWSCSGLYSGITTVWFSMSKVYKSSHRVELLLL